MLSGYIFRQSLKGKDAEETGKYLVSFVVAAIFIIAYEPVKTACPEKSEKLSELIQEKLPPDGDAPVKRFDDAINSFYSDVLRMAVQTEYFLSINPDDMDLLQLFKKLVMILNLNPEFRKDRFYNTSSSPSSEADDTGTLEITGDNYSKEHL